jgi:hypothetical protein
MKLKFSRQIVENFSNMKFHENPSSGAQFFQADGQTDKTKLTVAFRNFENAPPLLKKTKDLFCWRKCKRIETVTLFTGTGSKFSLWWATTTCRPAETATVVTALPFGRYSTTETFLTSSTDL